MLHLEELLLRTEKLLGESDAFHSALPELLKTIGEELHWNWGVYWRVESSIDVLRTAALWKSDPALNTAALERATSTRSLALSEGLAGQVWRNGKPFLSTDLLKQMCLPRSISAHQAGFRSGLWFAAKTGKLVHGVFEFLGSKIPDLSPEDLLEIAHYGEVVGSYLDGT